MSTPGVKPRAMSGSTRYSRVQPTKLVDVRMMVWFATALATAVAHAERSAVRSGARCAVDRRRHADQHGIDGLQAGRRRRSA